MHCIPWMHYQLLWIQSKYKCVVSRNDKNIVRKHGMSVVHLHYGCVAVYRETGAHVLMLTEASVNTEFPYSSKMKLKCGAMLQQTDSSLFSKHQHHICENLQNCGLQVKA